MNLCFKGTDKMLYTLMTVAILLNTTDHNNTEKPKVEKEQVIAVEKMLNKPKTYKISEKVKYHKVPTKWERS